MSLKVYINDTAVDLNPEEVVAITKQVADIANISQVKSQGSNQFKIPKTSLNRQTLESVDEVSSNSNLPYQKNTAKIIQDGMEILPNGRAIIEAGASDYYRTRS